VLIESVKADDKDSIVRITGLHASQRYVVRAESRCASGVTSVENSTICVTTLTDVSMTVLCSVLVTLAAVLAVLLIAGAIFSIWRYLCHLLTDHVGGPDGAVCWVCVSPYIGE